MDSLLASYASSDEEEDQKQPQQQNQATQSQPTSRFGVTFFSSLPPPKSEPSKPPVQTIAINNPSSSKPKKSSQFGPSGSLFSSLPQPKTERADPFSLGPKPKKVVQFRPPVNPSFSRVDDEDDDDDEGDKDERRKKENSITQTPSVKSFLSSIPAPRNSGSLGALPSSAGTGRRSILEGEVPRLSNSNVVKETANKANDDQVKFDGSFVGADNSSNVNQPGETYINYENVGANGNADAVATSADYVSYDYSNHGGYGNVDTDHSSYGPAAPASDNHANYGSCEDYGDYGQYESKWIDRSRGDMEPEISGAAVESFAKVTGKRGRNEIPQEVIEVNQDELMKNRPREDQVKLTGIAFGPAYQPASSGKGKPSKLHKRKHQIGTLYFDMRQKEMELAERRSKGFLTKAQTQAKYGW